MALTPIQAKCLETLVIKHIKEAVPPTLDPYEFAYTLDCIPHYGIGFCTFKQISQYVRFGKHTSSTLLIHTGTPQGCVLSPLLYTLFTHDCCITVPTNLIVKFVDDTTVLGLINNDNKSAYKSVVHIMV